VHLGWRRDFKIAFHDHMPDFMGQNLQVGVIYRDINRNILRVEKDDVKTKPYSKQFSLGSVSDGMFFYGNNL